MERASTDSIYGCVLESPTMPDKTAENASSMNFIAGIPTDLIPNAEDTTFTLPAITKSLESVQVIGQGVVYCCEITEQAAVDSSKHRDQDILHVNCSNDAEQAEGCPVETSDQAATVVTRGKHGRCCIKCNKCQIL